ncbi:uncharacterized protein LOC144620683 [Crassostrea virginica]
MDSWKLVACLLTCLVVVDLCGLVSAAPASKEKNTYKHAEESSEHSTNSTSGSDEEPPLDSPDAGEGTSSTDSTDTGGEDFFTDTDFTDTLDDISSDDSTVIDGALTVESDDLPEEPITVPPSNSNTLGGFGTLGSMTK